MTHISKDGRRTIERRRFGVKLRAPCKRRRLRFLPKSLSGRYWGQGRWLWPSAIEENGAKDIARRCIRCIGLQSFCAGRIRSACLRTREVQNLLGCLMMLPGIFANKSKSQEFVPSVLRFGRKSKPQAIFMNMVGNDLNDITGSWLDEEVGILTEVAFGSPDIIDIENARRARRQAGPRRTARKVRR